MADLITEVAGFPVNAAGEIIISPNGSSDLTPVGVIPAGLVPVVVGTGGVAMAGAGGGGSAAPIQITSSRNLVAADNGATLYSTSSSPFTLTLPTGLPSGFGVAVVQSGTGKVTIAGSGTTLTNVSTLFGTSAQNAVICAIQTTANAYTISGSVG